MSKRFNIYLILALVVALLLRVAGTLYGFPFIFHPDEATVVRSALGVRFNPNPGHFDWPHLFIYLNYFLFMIFAKIRTIFVSTGVSEILPAIVWDDNLIFYLLTRVFSAVLGSLTVIPVYLSGKKLFEVKTGILAAFVFTLIPFHVWHSHYSLIDVPMVFFLSWALYFSSRIILEGCVKDYILAGLFIGFASSTKYNGALGALYVLAAFFINIFVSSNKTEVFKKSLVPLLLSGIFSALGFVLGTPYSVFDYKTFIRTDGPQGALWQFTNVGSVSVLVQISQFFTEFIGDFPNNLGVTFWVMFLLGSFYVLLRFRKSEESPRSFYIYFVTFAFLFYVSGLKKTRAQYFMIAYPTFAVAVAYIVGAVSQKLGYAKLRLLLLILVFLSPLTSSINNTLAFVKKDTREILYEWIKTEVDKDDLLMYDGGDLTPVFESHVIDNETKKTKSSEADLLLYGNGYLFVEGHSGTVINIDGKETTLTIDSVEYISDYGRRGPKIWVYKLPITLNEVD